MNGESEVYVRDADAIPWESLPSDVIRERRREAAAVLKHAEEVVRAASAELRARRGVRIREEMGGCYAWLGEGYGTQHLVLAPDDGFVARALCGRTVNLRVAKLDERAESYGCKRCKKLRPADAEIAGPLPVMVEEKAEEARAREARMERGAAAREAALARGATRDEALEAFYAAEEDDDGED